MSIRRRSIYADRLLDFREFVFSDGAEFAHRGAWRDYFGPRIGPSFDGRISFEVGCNDAAFLAKVAAKHPMTAFIGIDWKCRALHTAAERISVERLQNVALIHGRAQDIACIFSHDELDEIWVFHPDPCDKPRELPNRLLAEPFLIDANLVLRERGAILVKTDHQDYIHSVVRLFEKRAIADRFEIVHASADFWNDVPAQASAVERSFGGEITAFERRFIRKRQPIHYLDVRKRQAAES